MVQGNFAQGDYWIDCEGVSQSLIRAIFGVWLNICAAGIAFSIRSLFRSRAKRLILSNDPQKQQISVWSISPAVTSSEVFELRTLLSRALLRGDYPYVLASLVCVFAAIVSAASTTISNHAIITNTVVRNVTVPGILVTSDHAALSGAIVDVTARVKALTRAKAPLEELFDFVPNDSFNWVYVPGQWNNTWKGECNYNEYPAVDLVVFPSNTSIYQEEVPFLGDYLPYWATLNATNQGVDHSGSYMGVGMNGTGAWGDLIVTYAFGSVPDSGSLNNRPSFVNISFANYLAHEVARDPDTYFMKTALKSDVHVVDCTFVNTAEAPYFYQAHADVGQYLNAAGNVANMYKRAVNLAALHRTPVTQPTAREMLRYWQAFTSVRDSQYPFDVERTLSVSHPVVQIRLSAIVCTVGAFFLAILAAIIYEFSQYDNPRYRTLYLPSSQLDWAVQAAREHLREQDSGLSNPANPSMRSPAAYAARNDDIAVYVAIGPDGQPKTWLRTTTNRSHTSTPGKFSHTNLSQLQ